MKKNDDDKRKDNLSELVKKVEQRIVENARERKGGLYRLFDTFRKRRF